MPLPCTQLVGLIELEEGASFQDAWEASPDWSTCPSLAGRYLRTDSNSSEEPHSAIAIEADSLQLRCDLESAYAEILGQMSH